MLHIYEIFFFVVVYKCFNLCDVSVLYNILITKYYKEDAGSVMA